jgi:hypothetical protein
MIVLNQRLLVACRRIIGLPPLEAEVVDYGIERQTQFVLKEAASKRSETARWANLFIEGQDDIILPLTADTKIVADRIGDYIERFNEANPPHRIRREPNPLPGKPERLEVFNAKKGEWQTGPRLGKFLQDHLEWALYDFYRAEQDARMRSDADIAAGQIQLADIAHSMPVAADTIDPSHLRVVISRDPYKIGAMSFGRRWESCMGPAGRHFEVVPRDVEAGTLIAYVVHKDDPEARFPLMRQLLKPFHNDSGQTVLVPAFVYGAGHSGNSATCEAFKVTTNQFVARHNARLSGTFWMDPRLYRDGQASSVSLRSRWDHEDLKRALFEFQEGVLEEVRTELQRNVQWAGRGEPGQFGEDPAATVDKLQRRMSRVMRHDDNQVGLPRMFFDAQLHTGIGAVARPADIIAAIADFPELQARGLAFQAMQNCRQDAWEAIEMPTEYKFNILINAAISSRRESPQPLWQRVLTSDAFYTYGCGGHATIAKHTLYHAPQHRKAIAYLLETPKTIPDYFEDYAYYHYLKALVVSPEGRPEQAEAWKNVVETFMPSSASNLRDLARCMVEAAEPLKQRLCELSLQCAIGHFADPEFHDDGWVKGGSQAEIFLLIAKTAANDSELETCAIEHYTTVVDAMAPNDQFNAYHQYRVVDGQPRIVQAMLEGLIRVPIEPDAASIRLSDLIASSHGLTNGLRSAFYARQQFPENPPVRSFPDSLLLRLNDRILEIVEVIKDPQVRMNSARTLSSHLRVAAEFGDEKEKFTTQLKQAVRIIRRQGRLEEPPRPGQRLWEALGDGMVSLSLTKPGRAIRDFQARYRERCYEREVVLNLPEPELPASTRFFPDPS